MSTETLEARIARLEAKLAEAAVVKEEEVAASDSALARAFARMQDLGLRSWTVAAVLGVSSNTLQKMAASVDRKFKKKRREPSLEEIADVAELLENHGPFSISALATMLNLSPDTIKRILDGTYENSRVTIPDDLQLRLLEAAERHVKN